MTTPTAVLIPHTERHIGPHAPRKLEVAWVAGTEDCITINQRVARRAGECADFEQAIRECSGLYIRGPDGENYEPWRELFGAPWAFRSITEMTLGFASIFPDLHLLRLWSDDNLVIQIASRHYDTLLKLFHCLGEDVGAFGFEVVSWGYGPRGLLYKISR